MLMEQESLGGSADDFPDPALAHVWGQKEMRVTAGTTYYHLNGISVEVCSRYLF